LLPAATGREGSDAHPAHRGWPQTMPARACAMTEDLQLNSSEGAGRLQPRAPDEAARRMRAAQTGSCRISDAGAQAPGRDAPAGAATSEPKPLVRQSEQRGGRRRRRKRRDRVRPAARSNAIARTKWNAQGEFSRGRVRHVSCAKDRSRRPGQVEAQRSPGPVYESPARAARAPRR
jgi:hypothetical protein